MNKSIRVIFCLLCVFSGLSSLIYETLWIRVLSLGVGSTSASMSLVLSIFFLGLSLGSFFSGRWAARVREPWFAYGKLEGLIGLYGALVIFPLFKFSTILAWIPFTQSVTAIAMLAKGLLVFLFLILPTFCMGATLPLLVRASDRVFDVSGRAVSLLYGLNTLGAVLGAALTGFILIPKLGILGSNELSAVLNLAVLGVTYGLRNKVFAGAAGGRTESDHASRVAAVGETASSRQRLRAATLAVCAACGFSSIAAEVVWSKYLSIFLGTNIFGLALVLALYLIGIALGSLAVSAWGARIREPLNWLAGLLAASLVALLVASRGLNFAPVATNVIGYYIGSSISLLAIKCLVTLCVLVVPTFFFGAIFPLCVSILSNHFPEETDASLLGTAYSLNTIGSIVGSCVAGLVLIPLWGSSSALQAAILGLGGTLVWFAWGAFERQTAKLAWSAAMAGVFAFAFLSEPVQFRNIISSAYYQSVDANLSLVEAVRYFSKGYEEFKLIYEGKSGVISLSHDPADGASYKRYLRLKTSGLNESIYNLDNLETLPKYEALLGFLPYSLVRNPQSAFLVGYGGGYTTDFLTRATLKQVHVVELEEGVLKAADIVYSGKNPIVERPNLELEINDARYTLASQPGRAYDMILSQPSHSWLTGVANLFTREFFEIVRSRLSDKGVFSQWLNLYNMDATVLRSILKTFYEVFPYGAVFTQPGDQEMIMIGSVKPVELNLHKMELLARDSKIERQLSQIPFKSGYDVAAQVAISRTDVLNAVGDAPINTDVNAYAEVGQTRLFYQKPGPESDPQAFLDRAYTGDLNEIVHVADTDLPTVYEGVLQSLKDSKKYSRMVAVLARYEAALTATVQGSQPARAAEAYSRLGYWCLQAERYRSASRYLQESLRLKPDAHALQLLLASQVSIRDFSGAVSAGARYASVQNDASRCFLAHAQVETSGAERARAAFAPLERDSKRFRQACGSYYDRVMGTYRLAQHQYKEAIPFLEAYYLVFGHDVRIISGLVQSYLSIGDWPNGKNFSAYLQTAIDNDAKHRGAMSDFFKKKGWAEDAQALESLKL